MPSVSQARAPLASIRIFAQTNDVHTEIARWLCQAMPTRQKPAIPKCEMSTFFD